MQAAQPMARRGRGQRPAGPSALSRAIRYLGKQKRTTIIAYGALIIATLAQLVVPLLLQNMINTTTDDAIAKSIFEIENPLVRAGALGLITQQTGRPPNNSKRRRSTAKRGWLARR